MLNEKNNILIIHVVINGRNPLIIFLSNLFIINLRIVFILTVYSFQVNYHLVHMESKE